MKKNRDFVNEIETIKQRTIGVQRYSAMKTRLDSLDKALDAARSVTDERARNELLRYIPIGSVACMEGFFRLAIRDLIDKGSPFSDNAAQLNKNNELRLDLKALQAIQYRRVTLGEFISHLLPINNLDDINHHLSKIISVDFLDSIKTVDAKFEQLLLNSVDAVIGDVIKGVNDIFNMRHVFCHELALRERAEIEIIQQAYMMMKAFLCRSSRFLDSVEHPIDDGEVMCQRELNQKANDDFLALEDQLNRLIEQIHDRDKKQLEEGYNDRVHPPDEESLRKDIEDVHVAFMNYREISARYDARDWIGGSGYPMVYFGTLSELTKQMLDELKRSREMEDNFRLLRQYCW